ncbi:Endonuclease V, partial [Frankliniella fusca]
TGNADSFVTDDAILGIPLFPSQEHCCDSRRLPHFYKDALTRFRFRVANPCGYESIAASNQPLFYRWHRETGLGLTENL